MIGGILVGIHGQILAANLLRILCGVNGGILAGACVEFFGGNLG